MTGANAHRLTAIGSNPGSKVGALGLSPHSTLSSRPSHPPHRPIGGIIAQKLSGRCLGHPCQKSCLHQLLQLGRVTIFGDMKLLQRRQHRSQVNGLFGCFLPRSSGSQVIHRSRQGIGGRRAGLGGSLGRIRAPTTHHHGSYNNYSQPTGSHGTRLQRGRSKKSREGSIPTTPSLPNSPPSFRKALNEFGAFNRNHAIGRLTGSKCSAPVAAHVDPATAQRSAPARPGPAPTRCEEGWRTG